MTLRDEHQAQSASEADGWQGCAFSRECCGRENILGLGLFLESQSWREDFKC